MGENLNCPCTHWSRPTSSLLVTWFRLMWLVVPGATGGWGRRQRSLASGGFFTAASQIQSHGMRFSYIFHDSPGSFQILWFPWWCFNMFHHLPDVLRCLLGSFLARSPRPWLAPWIECLKPEAQSLCRVHQSWKWWPWAKHTHTHSANIYE